MSVNPLIRLRALLPTPPLLVGVVVATYADDTSDVDLPLGLGNTSVASGVATGTRLRVRGSSYPVGAKVFLRAGVIESRAPDGDPVEVVVGEIAALPFGPARLAFSGPVVAPAAPRTVPYTLDLAPFWTGGYNPREYTLTSGTLPAGLTLAAGTGAISGTPSVAGSATLTVSVQDSTNRRVASAPFVLTVT